MNSSEGTSLASIIWLIVVFLVFREVICWYWKQNKIVSLLTDINNTLKMIYNDPVHEVVDVEADKINDE